MRWLPLIALGSALIASSVRAQIPAELRGRPVVSVEVGGSMERSVSPRDIGIPVGVPLTRELLRRSVRRLIQARRFSDVQFDISAQGSGVRVIARLDPRLTLLRVDIVGNELFDDDAVRRTIDLREGSRLERGDLPALEEAITRAYAARGYEAVSVETTVRDTDDPGLKALVVRVNEGAPTTLLRLLFDGDALPPGTGAQGVMDLSEGDLFNREEVLEGARRTERFLRQAGFLETRLRLKRTHRAGQGVVLVFDSHVGPRYRVVLQGQGPVDSEDITDELRIGEEPLSRATQELMATRVEDLFRQRGFADVSARIVRSAVPRGHGARDVTRVDNGPAGYNPAGGGQRIDSLPPVDAWLTVEIIRGELLEVVGRAFPGARHLSPELLDEQFDAFLEEAIEHGTAIEPVDDRMADALFTTGQHRSDRPARRIVDVSNTWYSPAYEAAAEHVQELYRADGYLQAEVGPVAVDRLEDGRAVVAIPVYEGPRTHLYAVQLEGNDALGAREVLTEAGIERDQPFSYLALEQAKERILALYRNEGFFYASIEQEVLFSADDTRAEVRLRIVERFPVRIRNVEITGAERTQESLIRRVSALDEAELLTPRAMRRAQANLADLGVFSSVSVAPAHPDLAARAKTIVIAVSERRTQYIEARGGVSTGQGARAGLEYGIRNIGGTAVEVALRAQFGYQFFFLDDTLEQRFDQLSLLDRLERRVSATVAAPFIGLPNVRASLSVNHLRENERNFGLDANAIDLTIGWRPRRYLSLSLSADLENNGIEVLGGETYEEVLENTRDPRLQALLRVPEGISTLVATALRGTVDLRDNPFAPTRGGSISGTFEYAKTLRGSEVERGGMIEEFESHHLRLLFSGTGYAPLGRGVVFAAQLQLGRVIHLANNSETYPNRKFFLGGVDTLRGYLQDSLIPQDIADSVCAMSTESDCTPPADFNVNAIVQGGDVFMVVRGELRFPIVSAIHGGVFVDLGNSWVDASKLNPINLRPTAGLGLRITTPVGPIAFDYGFLLARRRYLSEPLGSFHFSIGLY